MTPDLKAKWIAALRSGDFHQGHGRLRHTIVNCHEFCCLGVLLEISEQGTWDSATDTYTLFGAKRSQIQFIDDWTLEYFGIASEDQNKLVIMNDGRLGGGKKCTFAEIADWIEQHLPTTTIQTA